MLSCARVSSVTCSHVIHVTDQYNHHTVRIEPCTKQQMMLLCRESCQSIRKCCLINFTVRCCCCLPPQVLFWMWRWGVFPKNLVKSPSDWPGFTVEVVGVQLASCQLSRLQDHPHLANGTPHCIVRCAIVCIIRLHAHCSSGVYGSGDFRPVDTIVI